MQTKKSVWGDQNRSLYLVARVFVPFRFVDVPEEQKRLLVLSGVELPPASFRVGGRASEGERAPRVRVDPPSPVLKSIVTGAPHTRSRTTLVAT